MLNCGMAESLAAWLRDEAAPRAAKLGSAAHRNRELRFLRMPRRATASPAPSSVEHAHGDALDVRALHLADGRRLELTDVNVDKPLREALRDTACHRFTTVLGPGDPFHEGHIHLDVIQRRSRLPHLPMGGAGTAAAGSTAAAASIGSRDC